MQVALRAPAIDTRLLQATQALGDILSLLAQRAPGPVAHALATEIALVVFPRDGTPLPFRIRFAPPARVVVVPGHVARPRTRIACTRQALRHWVRGDLDLAQARVARTFLVEGDPAPFRALAAALDAHEHTVVRAPLLSSGVPGAALPMTSALHARFAASSAPSATTARAAAHASPVTASASRLPSPL